MYIIQWMRTERATRNEKAFPLFWWFCFLLFQTRLWALWTWTGRLPFGSMDWPFTEPDAKLSLSEMEEFFVVVFSPNWWPILSVFISNVVIHAIGVLGCFSYVYVVRNGISWERWMSVCLTPFYCLTLPLPYDVKRNATSFWWHKWNTLLMVKRTSYLNWKYRFGNIGIPKTNLA